MKVSTTVCAFLLVLLLCTCTQLASARSLPLNSKHVINREIKKIIKEIVREIKQESALTLADDQPNMSVEECPPPLTRTDENVNTFITGLTAMKCLDEKLNAFNKYIEDTALPFTYSQVNKIIAVFSTYDFIKIHITKVMLKRMVNLTSGEAVTLIKSVATTQMEMYNTLALVKERITDLKDKSSVLVSLFSDADIKTKVQQELEALKKVEENCIFGRVDSEQIVFVIDVSGSMEAVANPTSKLTRLDFVKQHLKSVMSSLKPEQKIEIVYFNNGVDVQFGELKQVNEATINNMLTYLQKKKPGYGTNVSAGLQRAFNMLYKSVASNSRTIYLLSDGIPNEGVTSVSQMKTFVSELSQKTGAKVNTVSFTMGTYDKGETDQVKENAAKMMNSIALAAGGTYRLIKSN